MVGAAAMSWDWPYNWGNIRRTYPERGVLGAVWVWFRLIPTKIRLWFLLRKIRKHMELTKVVWGDE